MKFNRDFISTPSSTEIVPVLKSLSSLLKDKKGLKKISYFTYLTTELPDNILTQKNSQKKNLLKITSYSSLNVHFS